MATTSNITRDSASLAGPGSRLTCFSEVADQTLEWLWPQRIAIGKLTLIVGAPGLGKGFLSVDLAARVSRGMSWPDSPHFSAPPGSALMLSAEDDIGDTVAGRLRAAGADLDRVAALEARHTDDGPAHLHAFSLQHDLQHLEEALKQLGDCRLVVIDPITAYLGTIDGNRNSAVRAILKPLSDLAVAYRVAIVGVTHLNKSESGLAINRALGALSFVAAARSVWGVEADPDRPSFRLLLPIKNNLAEGHEGLRFRLVTNSRNEIPRIEWDLQPVSASMDEVLSRNRRFNLATQKYHDGEHYAEILLKELLSDGPATRQAIGLRATELSDSQLQRASARLGVVKVKLGIHEGWIWMLPEHVETWHRATAGNQRSAAS